MSSEKELENYLLHNIPLSKAMGVVVKAALPQKIILVAPILNNINHKQTVFGGSLHSVATLACWSLLHLNLNEKDAQIVIAKSEIDYLAPVTTDFEVECLMPDAVEWDMFLKTFEKRGKGRIQLNAQIVKGKELCVKYSGIFIAMRIA